MHETNYFRSPNRNVYHILNYDGTFTTPRKFKDI